mgnify:CR=1 FL=1
MILRLTAQHLNLLRKEAIKAHPIEACGLLFGKLKDKTEGLVTKIVTAPNILHSTVRFEIDPKAFYDALMQAEKDGIEFIGLFHSHPAPATPSGVDIEFMRLWGDIVWLILSSTENEFAAFQMINGKIHSMVLKVE